MPTETDIWSPEPEEYELVREEILRAPRLFASCELDRDDDEWELTGGRVCAWGLAFDNRAEVISTDGRGHGSFCSPARAAELYARTSEVRLVYP
ncbi:hypothetical protein [Saccharopolyspora phatthalungensis]|uniref:Uncharacterized protein n=1 Tax=Saccharopolyspora phatthalungensis TaxID=664693 RepID=A0A840PXI8_9PSEU|nr:hypothetical protein [Saccharopolyspora phatthalungensis]MBB5152644.1 hypothetical protein [Saccharopolyspora phatthalungensis]